MNKICTKLRHSLGSRPICDIEITRNNISPTAANLKWCLVPLSSHKRQDRVFHLLSSGSFPFLVNVRHFLNRRTVFLAHPLAQRPWQPPSSAYGSASTAVTTSATGFFAKARSRHHITIRIENALSQTFTLRVHPTIPQALA